MRKKNTTIGRSLLGALVVLAVGATVTIGFNQYLKSLNRQTSIFTEQVNQETSPLEPKTPLLTIDRSETVKREVLTQTGVTQIENNIIKALKNNDYSTVENYLNPNKKLIVNFKYYSGAHFSKQEFHNAYTQSLLDKIIVYNNSKNIITAANLLAQINTLLNSTYKTTIYIDDHNYVTSDKKTSDYSKAVILYKLGGQTARLGFSKSAESQWYLSTIGYSP